MSGPQELERATLEDYAKAVETDGRPVDPYVSIAAAMFGVSPGAVTKRMKNAAKIESYRRMYGGGGRVG